MKRFLVLMETDGASIHPRSEAAVDVARACEIPFDLLITGGPSIEAEASKWTGVGADRVLIAVSDALMHSTADRVAAVCAALMDGETSLIGPASISDVLARVAGALDLPMVTDVDGVSNSESGIVFHSLAFDGRIRQTVRVDAPRAVLSVQPRTAGLAPEIGATNAKSTIEHVAIDSIALPAGTIWVSTTSTVHRRPPLHEASVIVAGGRSLGDSASFEQYLGPVADRLDGAVAASGGAVHSGIAPSTQLIGQTGQTVSPDLYIAVGISGADQHIGGMQNSRVIVAINRDPQAAIFRVADYGLVADYHDALPELAEKLAH